MILLNKSTNQFTKEDHGTCNSLFYPRILEQNYEILPTSKSAKSTYYSQVVNNITCVVLLADFDV